MFRKKCLFCNNKNLNDIINLGSHPLADTFISKSNLHLSDKVYPLIVQICNDCKNIQLKCKTTPEERYQENDYSYTSSNSNYSRHYWEKYAEVVLKLSEKKTNIKILEIGSNDGYLLKQFKDKGHKVLGIDASPYIAKIAQKNLIDTEIGIFDENFANKINNKVGNFDVVIANNVFNHSDNPTSFFKGVKKLLSKDGFFIFESPYWSNSIISGKFDQIYHEHVTYVNVRSINKLAERTGLSIYDTYLSDYHGGSLGIIIKIKKNKKNLQKIKFMINQENKSKLYSNSFYDNFMKKINNRKYIFMEKIYKNLIKQKPLICIGAAAKANTFLNFYGLDNKIVNFITDSSTNKIGKYTPLTRIPIEKDQIIKKFKNPNIIFTAWNVSDNLKKIISKINPKYTELKPYEN